MENPSSISLIDNTLPTDGPPRQAPTAERRLSRKNLARKIHGIRRKSGASADATSITTEESPSVTDLSSSYPQVDTSKSPQATQQEALSPRATQQSSPPTEQRDQGQQQPKRTPTSQIDILYENQRGWFIFGVPLYSHQSLLQLDPGAWVTSEGKDSPVSITNAQVPDPSWEWAWKTWYVDMSGDVDEQGWQYSFSFGSRAWHGSHPWFHCFVRRRQWLRLRVKRTMKMRLGQSNFERAHMLNDDYFTIHSSAAKDQRQTSIVPMSATQSAYSGMTSGNKGNDADLLELEEITDIPMLMYALKCAIVDREKLDYLKRFVEQGGEELYYLNEKVRIANSLNISLG